MAVVQSAGAKLYIGGIGDLGTEAGWTEVGEITNFGEFGRSYELVTHNAVSTRTTEKFKGSRNDGSLQLTMARAPSDAGQADLQDALDSDDKYNFKVELDDAPAAGTPTTFTFKGLVMSYTSNIGEVNGIVQASVTVEISGDITETAAAGGA